MKRKSPKERGQALVIIALSAIALFGIAGLAIDGSIKFSDRRHAQNAADTAALAGALSLGRDETTWKLNALDIAGENGYDDNHLSNEVEVYRCNETGASCGAYAGSTEYVQVIITSDVTTYFARILGINETHNTVQAVALAQKGGPLYDGNLIVALNPNPCTGSNGNIVLGGNSDINLTGGGIFVNSGGSGCGIELSGCPTLDIDGGINSTGTGNVHLTSSSASCTADITGIPSPTYNNDPYDFPPEMPAEPAECTTPYGTYSSPNSAQTVVTPGRWNEFPPKGSGVNDEIIMNPGVYCVDDVIKLSNQHLVLKGQDVTIYVRSNNYFQIEGGTVNLDAPDTGPYAGYLIIVDSDFSGTSPQCSIDGNSVNTYDGTIFAPYCDVKVNGDSTGTNLDAQIIGYTVTLNGSATMNINYDIDKVVHDPRQVGLIK